MRHRVRGDSQLLTTTMKSHTTNYNRSTSKSTSKSIISLSPICFLPAFVVQLFIMAWIMYTYVSSMEDIEFRISGGESSSSSFMNDNAPPQHSRTKLRDSLLLKHHRASTETQLQHGKQQQQQPQQKQNKQLRDDGCYLDSQVEPQWIPETPTRKAMMEKIDSCIHPLTPIEPRYTGASSAHKSSMICDTQPSPEVLKQYRRIWFIGDSVHLQQFMALNCWIMGSTFAPHRSMRECGEQSVYEHDLGTTNLIYSELGWNFKSSNHEAPLYDTVFPQAIQTSTAEDAIVINLGLHYDSTRADLLQKAAKFIVKGSQNTNATVFVMETSDEQWPTSNGVWSPQCVEQMGQCEAVTPERQRGRGKWGSKVDLTMDIDRIPEPDYEQFGNLYPNLFLDEDHNYEFKVKTGVDPTQRCVPDCLPANWRNDMVRPLLLQDDSKITLVPIWKQLVSQQANHARRNGDCIHKALDALQVMNEQLLRSMQSVVQYGQRDHLQEGHPASPTSCGPETKLKVIVTGMEYTGMTYMSELIMSAPGYLGPFQTGFLLAITPPDIQQMEPYNEWLQRSEPRNEFFGLSPHEAQEVVQVDTVLGMYDYVVDHSPIFNDTHTHSFVDKTPAYIYQLPDVMKRAPSAKVVICVKTWKEMRESWIGKHGKSPQDFQDSYALYLEKVKEARALFPDRIYIVEYNSLFGKYLKGDKAGASKTGRALFDWLGLKWHRSYLKGESFRAKNRNCNLCSLNH